ncbi:Long chain acyl-CoA synthetase [Arachis hypogaea]|nr:Long chain acyl-CoA synthetase [Arachis hypogaea]
MSPSTIFLDEIDAIISQRVEARSEHEASKRLKTELLIQACNSHSVTYVPLYDTLGPNAVEFIINHAQVSIAFVQENNIPSILSCLGQCSSNLITIVSFGNVSTVQKKEAEEHGDLPPKKKTDICTFMYTSGTTGKLKGVIIKNEAFIAKQAKMMCTSLFFLLLMSMTREWRPIPFRGEPQLDSGKAYLIEDVQVLKLTIFCGVPRVFDRVYAGINSKISSGGAFESALFYKLGYLDKGLPQDKAAPFFDRLVFDKKAATKRMDMQASKEFLAELKVLTHVHHLNLAIIFDESTQLFGQQVLQDNIEEEPLNQLLHGEFPDDTLVKKEINSI